jgi:hypothetical protein
MARNRRRRTPDQIGRTPDHMGRTPDRVRRTSAALGVIGVLVLILAGTAAVATQGVPASTPVAPNGDTTCEHWCGNGSAVVNLGGVSTTISGGGCYDQGSAGYDIRFGDWQGLQGVSTWLGLTAYKTGGPTPSPTAPPNPEAAPSATDHASPIGGGGIFGNDFVLGSDATVTLNADGTGTFSGTDVDGAGPISGTFRCN